MYLPSRCHVKVEHKLASKYRMGNRIGVCPQPSAARPPINSIWKTTCKRSVLSTASLIARGGFRYPGTVFWTVYSISAVSHPTKKNQSFKHIPSPIWCLRTPPLTKKNVTLWSPKLVYLGLCQTIKRFWKTVHRRIGFPGNHHFLVLESPTAYCILSEALCAGKFSSRFSIHFLWRDGSVEYPGHGRGWGFHFFGFNRF